VECRKYQEHITAAVDNALDPREKEHLDAHLAACPRCRSELEFERATRTVVRARCARRHAPGHVVQRVSQALEGESIAAPGASLWNRLISSLYFRPAIGFALAALVVIFLVNNRTPSPRVVEAALLPSNDVIKQSLANYDAVTRGEIKTQVTSDQSESVRDFFAGKTEFPVVVPKLAGFRLLGGVANEYGGKTLAHVVYKHSKSEVVYVYETCWETVQNGAPFHLSDEVKQELNATGWFTTTSPDGQSLVMWTDGKTLCTAVSRLDPESLRVCLMAAR